MESLEGKRGIPRIRPPFPAVVGLYGGPTIINNAETLATVPHIFRIGGAEYAKIGTERNGGTRLFCLSGNVAKPGVYELPMGYNLKKMIYEVGGGIPNGRSLKAVVPGGSSTPVLLPSEIDIGMDFDQVGKAGSMLGSGGVVVLDDPGLHGRVCPAHHEVLPARELRLVYSLPRRHRLAEEDAHPLPRRGRGRQRYRQHSLPGAEHAGPHLLPAG